MQRGRPKGSKTQKPTTRYNLRTRRMKKKHGVDCYKKWGKQGGNPILLKHRRQKK